MYVLLSVNVCILPFNVCTISDVGTFNIWTLLTFSVREERERPLQQLGHLDVLAQRYLSAEKPSRKESSKCDHRRLEQTKPAFGYQDAGEYGKAPVWP